MEKLTLVSLYYRYHRYQAFVMLPVATDGKVRISEDQLFKLFKLNPDRGETYTPGG